MVPIHETFSSKPEVSDGPPELRIAIGRARTAQPKTERDPAIIFLGRLGVKLYASMPAHGDGQEDQYREQMLLHRVSE